MSSAESTRQAVEFRGVSKRYGTVTAVDDVSFAIASGTLVTLLGPSGCGKTTILRMIAGLEQVSSGSILIDGEDVTLLPATQRNISMVFQSYALFPHMTVMENVCYGLRASGMGKARAEPIAAEKLRQVGLAGYERRLPSELSGGQQQRVAVARAIVLEPKVLLFDEPLSNLDTKLRRRVREEIRELQQSLTLTAVYVTHDQQEALAISDRVIVMNGGLIEQIGTPEEISVPSVRVKRATAIFRSNMPTSGKRSSMRSIVIRPTGVPYQTFTPMHAPTNATKTKKPKILPTKLLSPITMRVGRGKSTPKPTNNVVKIGTTFHNSSVITAAATASTAVG
jgi:ABC-type Fe3+/spermidine/putrescine transport system ATPase subunit